MKVDYNALKAFGCACWPCLRPYNSRKFDFRSKQCTFLGYNNLYKGYKYLDISTSRIYISRDVIFDEEIFPFSKLHANAGARFRAELSLLPLSLLNLPNPRGMAVHDHVCDAVPDNTNDLSSVQENLEESAANTGDTTADNGSPTRARHEDDLLATDAV